MNVLLLTIDSLRADALSSFAGERRFHVATPNLDRLATEGVVFETACSPSSYTWGVFASLFLSAPIATVTDENGVLCTQFPTMAELFRQQGYRTGGFHSNPFLSATFGYERGFDRFDSCNWRCARNLPNRFVPWMAKAQRLVARQPYVPAPAINRKACDWLAGARQARDGRPFFLWVHYMDVHGPYQPKTGFVYRNKLRAERLWHKAVTTPKAVSPAELEELARSYAEELTYLDRAIGDFLGWLREVGLYGDTVVVLCADHGDEFGEHGRFSHWRQLYDELVRVPLIVRHPRCRAGIRIQPPVSLVDVLPTLVEMLGFAVPGGEFAGQSLWPVIRDGDSSRLSGVVVGDAAPDRKDRIVYLRTARWKLIFDSTKEGYELYDLACDAKEQTNVAGEFPDKVRELSERLWARLERQRTLSTDSSALELDEEVVQRLRALGYVEWLEEHSALS